MWFYSVHCKDSSWNAERKTETKDFLWEFCLCFCTGGIFTALLQISLVLEGKKRLRLDNTGKFSLELLKKCQNSPLWLMQHVFISSPIFQNRNWLRVIMMTSLKISFAVIFYAFGKQCWNLKLDYLLFPLCLLSVSLFQQLTCWQNVLLGLNFSLYVLPVLSCMDHIWQITFNCCSFLRVCNLTRGACGEGTTALCTAALLQPGSVSISTNVCHVLPRWHGFELTGVALELLEAVAEPLSSVACDVFSCLWCL